jgi:hypothetical protein
MEPNRYQQGKIYKIVSPHTDKIYIGSTCKEFLSQRLAAHKSDFKKWQNNKITKVMSFDLIQLGEVEIILLELYPCNSKDELTSRERYWYDLNKELVINKLRPHITYDELLESKKEDYINNKEHYSQLHRQWRQNNAEKKKEMDKKYHEIKFNCECGSNNISYAHKKRHCISDKHQTYLMIQTL